MPSSKGSTWHYKNDQQGNFTLTATGRDTVVNGITLHVFENKFDNSPEVTLTYFGQKDDDYYAMSFFPQLGSEMLLYLKGNVPPGTQWTQTAPINIDIQVYSGEVNAELTFSLAETGITKEVNGHTYDNVAHVSLLKVMGAIPNLGEISLQTTGDLYFSKGVGLIDVVINSPLSPTTEISLLDYSIKQ